MFDKVQFPSFGDMHPHFISLSMKMKHESTYFGMWELFIQNTRIEFESCHLIYNL